MKKIFYSSIILLFILFNVLTLNSRAEQDTEEEILYVVAEPIPVIEQKEEQQQKQEEVSTKTIAEIKNEEFNRKLDEIKQANMSNKEWFLAYKDLTYEYVEWVNLPETVYDVFSEEEINLICRVVETETYDQDFDSKVNVANVVFNRLDDGRFGDTITEIITATDPKQFVYGRKKITESTIWAVMYAYEMPDTTQGALYFHSFEEAKPTFNRASYLFTDQCGHHFYGFKED